MNAEPLVRLTGVSVGYGNRVVLLDVSLAFARGSFTGLLGANGSGKSSLIRTMLGIVPPLAGSIVFDTPSGLRPPIGYVPQRESLDSIFLLSGYEVALQGTCARVGPGRWIGRPEREFARHCLEQTGAADLSRRRFSELSGGQKQRVLIARALAAQPGFLVLDEPTTGLDAAAAQAVTELLVALNRGGLTLLMVSHDLPVVRRCVQSVVWLHNGRAEQGPVAQLLHRDKIEEVLSLALE